MSFEEAEKIYLDHYRKLGYAVMPVPLPPVVDKEYTPEQAAKRMSKSRGTIYNLLSSGDLGCLEDPESNRKIIRESDIQTFYNTRHKRKSNSEIKADADTFLMKERCK